METKFTPGPWFKRGKGTIETNGGAEVASVMYGQMLDRVDRETQEANAHLIAAAPELYEALEILYGITIRMMKQIPNSGFEPRSPLGKCEAALAKARGE